MSDSTTDNENKIICPKCGNVMELKYITKCISKHSLKPEWKRYYRCSNCNEIKYVRIQE